MPMVNQITVSTNEIYQLAFIKEVVLNRSSTGEITDSFVEHPVYCLLLAKSQQNCF